MNPKDTDRELARLFEELRRADEASAPGFQELMARTSTSTTTSRRAHRAPETRWIRRAALAAAAAIAVAAGVFLPRRPPEPGLPAAARTLAAWKAPTDVLLQTPGAELLGRLPVLVPTVPSGFGLESARLAPEATPTVLHR